MTYKVAWYVTITDHVGYSLHSPRILMETVDKYGDRITRIEQVITEWYGEHDKGTRNFVERARVDITTFTLMGTP